MFKMGLVATLAAILILAASLASASSIEIAAGAWNQRPSGDMASGGQTLDLKDNLGYGSETRVMGRAKIETPLFLPNVYLMATPMSFSGNGSNDVAFTFHNINFNANIPLSSKMRLDHYDVGLYYNLPFVKTATAGVLNVEAGVVARIVDANADVSQSTIGQSANVGATVAVPMVYIGAQVSPIKKLSIEAEAKGVAYKSNNLYDLIGRVKYQVVGPAFVSVGYRYEKLKIDTQNLGLKLSSGDLRANVAFAGPFAEVGVEFGK